MKFKGQNIMLESIFLGIYYIVFKWTRDWQFPPCKSDTQVRHFTFNSVCQDRTRKKIQRKHKLDTMLTNPHIYAVSEREQERKKERKNHRPSREKNEINHIRCFCLPKKRSTIVLCCAAIWISRNDSSNFKF